MSSIRTTRRAIVSGAAAIASIGIADAAIANTGTPAELGHTHAAGPAIEPLAPDPIFAAIARLEAAEIELTACCEREGDLAEVLPREKCLSDNMAGEVRLVPTDDPRWIDAMVRVRNAFDMVDVYSYDLLKIRPTTLAGLSALLRFCYDYEVRRGREFPDELPGRNGPLGRVTFLQALPEHAANCIDALVAVD